jgi:hypothetical protein
VSGENARLHGRARFLFHNNIPLSFPPCAARAATIAPFVVRMATFAFDVFNAAFNDFNYVFVVQGIENVKSAFAAFDNALFF